MKTSLHLLRVLSTSVFFIFSAYFIVHPVIAQVSQGFENVTGRDLDGGTPACLYIDPDFTNTHTLANFNADCGLIIVQENSSGSNLGYKNIFSQDNSNLPGDAPGFSDGDAFGVINAAGLTGQFGISAIQGTQAFIMEDPDGQIRKEFDFVDLSGTTNPTVSIKYFLEGTSWELPDYLYVHVDISGCGAPTSVTLIDTRGLDIDDLLIEESWNTLSANLTSYIGCTAQLVVEFSSNASTEELAIDDIQFSEGVIGVAPPPAICPTVGALSLSKSTACLNETFNATATGLDDMAMSQNMNQNYGINFVAFPNAVSNPYLGGEIIGSVPFGSLTGGNTAASISGTSLSRSANYTVYAILDPVPVDVTCRPFASAAINVQGCDAPCLISDPLGTSFETVYGQPLNAGTCGYIDADNITQHQLQNVTENCGPITVLYGGFASTLGFEHIYIPSNPAQGGFSDGDLIGVATNSAINNELGTNAIDGNQALLLEDIDGTVSLRFDEVNLSGTSSPMVSIKYFLSNTSWETTDFLNVYVDVTSCGAATTVTLLDTRPGGIEALGIENSWNTLSADLTAYIGCTVQLIVNFSSDAASEELGIDQIEFSEGCRVGSPPPIVCPTFGNTTSSESEVCLNETFDLQVSGLTNMDGASNNDQNFGIEFRAHPSAVANPYVGGTSLGTIAFANLTNSNSQADLTGALIGMTGMFSVYALLSPAPVDASCRPTSSTLVNVVGCDAPCTTSASLGNSFETAIGQNFGSGCQFVDPDLTFHELQNFNAMCGPIIVTYEGFADIVGFKTFFDPVSAQTTIDGFTDGDNFGVGTSASVIDNLGQGPTDGNQAFLMEDIGGNAIMIFDEIDLNGTTSPSVSIDYFLSSTSWDDADSLKISVNVTSCAGATSVSILDVGGTAIDALEGQWRTATLDLTPFVGCVVELELEFSSSESAEELGIDNLIFTEGCRLLPIDCPEIHTVVASVSNSCTNDNFDITASGLMKMDGATNMEQDFGINFKYFADAVSDPYTGGTSLGIVSHGSLTMGGTEAILMNASINVVDPDAYIYAVLDPAPTVAQCRPFVQTVISVGGIYPVCTNVTAYLDENGGVSISPSDVDGGSTADCGIDSMYLSMDTFTCLDIGANTVMLTIVDNDANTANCMATVTVEDTTSPEAICQDITVYLDASGSVTLDSNAIDGGASDNCVIASLAISPSTFSCADIGLQSVMMTVTDQSGNMANCFAMVTVLDTTAPIVQCRDITVQLDPTGNVAIDATSLQGETYLMDENINFSMENISGNTVTLSDDQVSVDLPIGFSFTFFENTYGAFRISSNGFITFAPETDNGCCSGEVIPQNSSTEPQNIIALFWEDLRPPSGGTISYSTIGTAPNRILVVEFDAVQHYFNGFPTTGQIKLFESSNAIELHVDNQDAGGNHTLGIQNLTGDIGFAPADKNGVAWTADDYAVRFSPSVDACGIANVMISDSMFSCVDLGSNSVTLTVTDVNGNSSSCTSIVTVEDNVAPDAICQDITVTLDALGVATITAADIDGGSMDACGIDTMTISNSFYDCTDIGLDTVMLTVIDSSGNMATCMGTVSVRDTTSPNALCQDITVYLDSLGNVTLDSNALDAGSSDNCGIASFSISPSTLTCSDIGSRMVSMMVIDGSGNASSCASMVTVFDTVSPVIECKNDTVFLDENGMVMLQASDVLTSSSMDNCGIDTVIFDNSTFSCSNIDMINNVLVTVKDASGQMSSCMSQVTVLDNLPPVIICQDLTVDVGYFGVVVEPSDIDNGSSDNCGIDSLYFALVDTTVSLLTTFADNNSSDGNMFTIKALNPMLIKSFDINPVNSNTFEVYFKRGSYVGFETNPSAWTLAAQKFVNSTGAGTQLDLDLNIPVSQNEEVSFYVTNANSDNLNYRNGPGEGVLFSSDVNLEFYSGIGIQYPFAQGGSIFRNRVFNGNIIYEILDPNFFSSFEVDCGDVDSTLAIKLVAEDQSENLAFCTSNITIQDNTPPQPFCRTSGNFVLMPDGLSVILASQLDVGSADNCTAQGDLKFSFSASDPTDNALFLDCSNLGVNNITLYIFDEADNVSSCTATFTVSDETAPTAMCNDVTVYVDEMGNYSITPADSMTITAGTSDACSPITTTFSQSTFDCSDIGIPVDVTVAYSDTSMNTSSCVSVITVLDTTSPMAMCNTITVYLDETGDYVLMVDDIDSLTSGSSDNCTDEANLTVVLAQNDFSCADTGPSGYALDITITDESGNMANCTATVIVVDTVAPDVVCQDITVQLDANGVATIDSNELDNGSTDACGIESIVADITTFGCADVGANTVTLTVTDVNGNSDTCAATVTVEDNVAPVALCQDITVFLDETGVTTIEGSDVDGGSVDACGIASLSVSPDTFRCADVGSNLVTLTVTDSNGQTSTCTANVTVLDTVPPTALCNDITVYLDASGSASIIADVVDQGSVDSCGIASTTVAPTSFGCAEIGNNVVTLTVTDVNGNSSSCMANVTVLDTVSPMAMCQDITVYLDDNGMTSITGMDVDNGSSDACGIETLMVSPSSFTCADIGANMVTLTVVDSNGNSSNCMSTVTVRDTSAPMTVCNPIDVYLDANGNYTLSTMDSLNMINGTSDNCNAFTASLSQRDFTCSDVNGADPMASVVDVTITYEDDFGNTSSCVSAVTVLDTFPPIVACRDINVPLNNMGEAIVPASFLLNAASFDICDGSNITVSYSATDMNDNLLTIDCSFVGTLPVEVPIFIWDQSGNMIECIGGITADDTDEPVAVCNDITIDLGTNASGSISTVDSAAIISGTSDNCDGSLEVSFNPSMFTCQQAGMTIPVEVVVTDPSGNDDTCIAMVTVEATTSPILYVDEDALGNNDGTSWTNAFTTLSQALASGGSLPGCGTIDEIWVAEGTYVPLDLAGTIPADPRSNSFVMLDGIGIYGGFDGSETMRIQRDPSANETILSGQDFTYHVLTNDNNNLDETAILDGFTITGGNADGSSLDDRLGGGMYNRNSSPTINGCRFENNSATFGGGILNRGSDARITNCFFITNTAATGGGIFNWQGTTSEIINCVFSQNMASKDGGAIMNNSSAAPEIINSSFGGNLAGRRGGGIFTAKSSTNNVVNSILWENMPKDIQKDGSSTNNITFSDITVLTSGAGNISADPMFTDPANHDLSIPQGSPAEGAGNDAAVPVDITEDIIGNARMIFVVDMGAYEAIFPVRRANEVLPKFTAKIYPNPTSHLIFIDMTGEFELIEWQMMDMQGRVVKKGINTSPQFQLDISDLMDSNYFIRLSTDAGVVTKMISKVRA